MKKPAGKGKWKVTPGTGEYLVMKHMPDRINDKPILRCERPEEAKAVASQLNRLMAKSDPVLTRGKFTFYYVHLVKSFPVLPWLETVLKVLEVKHCDNQEVVCGS